MTKSKQSSGAADYSAANNLPSGLHYVMPAQVDVVPMEESDSDTEAVVPLETEGPFVNFAELKNRPAHLAVFLHYLISNCDPASLVMQKTPLLYSFVDAILRSFCDFSCFTWSQICIVTVAVKKCDDGRTKFILHS